VKLPLRSFRGQLLLVFVPVLALAQLATWYLVGRFNEREARQQIDTSLQQAAQTFRRVVADRNAHLRTGARSAARDHQIRQLVAGDDPATLASALQSLRGTTDSSVVAILEPGGKVVASAGRGAPESALPTRLIALAEADESERPSAAGYGYFDGVLHSVVLVPVQAGSEVIAWLLIGFRIDREFAADLKLLTGSDLLFLGADGAALAGTLAVSAHAPLASVLQATRGHSALRQITIDGGASLAVFRPLLTGREPVATLALVYSLDEKLAPARLAGRYLAVVAVGALVAAAALALAFARGLARPVERLAAHTERISAGDYAARVPVDRADELGRLAGAMNAMSAGLAERDRVRDLLDKNVSPEVAARLMRGGAALGGEEREVTILFADLRGFTTLSERLDPPALLALLNRYLDRMSGAIEAHGGVIDKFIGDAIMALFGAPVAQGDAPARAIAAARAMESALAALNTELAAEDRPPLAIGVGINTARVVAGNIGSNRRLNYSVIGDGVNVAARLQALTRAAEHRTNIILSAATRAAAGRAAADARPLGTVTVKGRTEPVEIFAIDAPLSFHDHRTSPHTEPPFLSP
jgi:adenylate cyclase